MGSLSVLFIVTIGHSAPVRVLEFGGQVERHAHEEQHVEGQPLAERDLLRGRVGVGRIVEGGIVIRIAGAVLGAALIGRELMDKRRRAAASASAAE